MKKPSILRSGWEILALPRDDKYMTAVKPTQEKVTTGDSMTVMAEGRGTACLTTSEGQDLQLEDCLYIPDFTEILSHSDVLHLGDIGLR